MSYDDTGFDVCLQFSVAAPLFENYNGFGVFVAEIFMLFHFDSMI